MEENENYEHLSELQTEELQAVMRDELHRKDLNEEKILTILRLLELRDKNDYGPLSPEAERAVEKFTLFQYRKSHTGIRMNSLGKTVIAVVAALSLMIVPLHATGSDDPVAPVPQWNNTVFWYTGLCKEPQTPLQGYTFQTENPELQRVYETLTAHAMVRPMVPTWLPEGYALIELSVYELPSSTLVSACFGKGEDVISMSYYLGASSDIYKDPGDPEVYTYKGHRHFMMTHYKRPVAVWEVDDVCCYAFTTESKETLIQVINSIYEGE